MSNASKWILGIFAVFAGFALLIFAFAIYTLTVAVTDLGEDQSYDSSSGTGTESVAVVEMKDVISTSDDVVRQLRKYQKNRMVKAIVLRVDSPGGAVSPSQEIYDEVRKTRDAGKPVVVSMGSVAASGGYYVSLGASKIVANPGTITGSIGVISQFTNLSGLMEKVGIENTTIKSGKFKDAGSPFRRMTPEEQQYWQSTIDNVYEQFVAAVSRERNIPIDSVKRIADGRIYTGEQAYRLRLVDTLGSYQTAISLAGTLGKIQGEPRVQRERQRKSLIEEIMGTRLSRNVEALNNALRPSSVVEYRLDTH
jgi:protease-4